MPSRDSTVQRAHVGLQWAITGKSTGTLRGGHEAKRFSDPARPTSTVIGMQANLDHQVTTGLAVLVQAERTTRESNLTTYDLLITTGGGVQVSQRLTDKTSAVFVVGYRQDDYPGGPLVQGRRDETRQTGGGLDYAYHDWVRAGLRYQWVGLNSVVDESDYVVNTYALSVAFVF